MTSQEPGPKRETKKNEVSLLIRRSADAASELAKTLEKAAQSQRQAAALVERRNEQVMAILEQNFGIRGQAKRGWPLLSENDQQVLRGFGFREPKEG